MVYVRPYAELLGRDPATPFVGAGEFQRGLIRAYERRASLRYALRHRDQFGGQWNSWDNADAQVAKISDLIERCTQSFEKIIKDSRGGSSQNDVFITNVGREEIANCLSGFSLIPRSIEPSSLLQANIWRRGIHPLTVLNYNKPFGAVLQGTYNRAGGDAAFECPRDCVQARVGSVIIRRPQNVTVVNPISGIDNTYRLIEIPTDAISLDWEMPDDGKWDDNLWRANSGILVFERVVPISGLSR